MLKHKESTMGYVFLHASSAQLQKYVVVFFESLRNIWMSMLVTPVNLKIVSVVSFIYSKVTLWERKLLRQEPMFHLVKISVYFYAFVKKWEINCVLYFTISKRDTGTYYVLRWPKKKKKKKGVGSYTLYPHYTQ